MTLKTYTFPSLVLFAVLVVLGLLVVGYPIHFANQNFWDHHGVFFLIFITIFPRLTLLFSSIPFGGALWWLGFLFVPRVLVAVLATVTYWKQNPVLVVIAWLIALSGETGEKTVVRSGFQKRQARSQAPDQQSIETEYRVKGE